MYSHPLSFEGWAPDPGDGEELARVIDLAFDYRGDVTLVLADGTERVGYVFNRHREASAPYLQIFEPDGTAPVAVRYAEIRTIRFTGRDTASGKSYAAWLERKAAAKGTSAPADA